MDAKEQVGRGLGPGFGEGKLLEAIGSLREEVDEGLMVQFFFDTSLSVESVLPKLLALRFCVVLCDPDYTVLTPRVGLPLNR